MKASWNAPLPLPSWAAYWLWIRKTQRLVTLKMETIRSSETLVFLLGPHGVISKNTSSFVVTAVKNIREENGLRAYKVDY
jgi:hypothetical protein